MQFSSKVLSRIAAVLLVVVLTSLVVVPVMAQVRPAMTVIATWRPGQELVSATPDNRFVNLEIDASGNIEFWAMNLSCRIGNGTQLIPVEAADNEGSFTQWGDGWFDNGMSTFYPDQDYAGYADTRGNVSVVASRVGSNTPPLGSNGVTETTRLVTLRFKVADGAAITRNTTVAASCTINFLDRDGRVIVRGRQSRSTPLSIIRSYEINGKVLNQASRNQAGISVDCTYQPTSPDEETYSVVTDRNGNFNIGGARSPYTLRNQGYYNCTFSNQQAAVNNVYLNTRTDFILDGLSYTLLPVTLPAGDVERSTSADNITFTEDIGAVTSAPWNVLQALPFTNGDVNGDRRINDADLAIVAGNEGWGDTPDPLYYTHTIYGLATDYASTSPPNSDIRVGRWDAGATTLIGRSRTYDFWPDVSPSGRSIAHVSVSRSRSGALSSSLMITDAVTGRATNLTGRIRGVNLFPLAPSWSPDGQKIAFISGYDYSNNTGALFVINADDTTGASLLILDDNVKIYPPTWSNNNEILYAGTNNHWACPNAICFQYVDSGNVFQAYADPGNVVDMPVITEMYDGTPPDGDPPPDDSPTASFYMMVRRTDGVGNTELRRIDFTIRWWYIDTADGFVTNGTLTIPNTVGVDYYNYKPEPGQALMYYGIGDIEFANQYYDYGADTWTGNFMQTHKVDGFIGVPWWDGTGTTDLHAFRPTFDWVP